MPFPEDGLVYDYSLDDAGISNFGADDDEIDDKSSANEVPFCYSVIKFSTLANNQN